MEELFDQLRSAKEHRIDRPTMPFGRLMWALKKERELEACLIWVGVDKEEAAFTIRQSEAFHCAQAAGRSVMRASLASLISASASASFRASQDEFVGPLPARSGMLPIGE